MVQFASQSECTVLRSLHVLNSLETNKKTEKCVFEIKGSEKMQTIMFVLWEKTTSRQQRQLTKCESLGTEIRAFTVEVHVLC